VPEREVEKEEEVEVEEVPVDTAAPEIVSLEEAETEEAGEEIPEVEDVEDVEDIGAEDEADVFLEEDDEEEENLDFDVGGEDR
jgi:hypothetical protein